MEKTPYVGSAATSPINGGRLYKNGFADTSHTSGSRLMRNFIAASLFRNRIRGTQCAKKANLTEFFPLSPFFFSKHLPTLMNSPSGDSQKRGWETHGCVENIECALFLLFLPLFEVCVKTYEDAIQDAK